MTDEYSGESGNGDKAFKGEFGHGGVPIGEVEALLPGDTGVSDEIQLKIEAADVISRICRGTEDHNSNLY